MSAKELIAEVYETHLRDHTATPVFRDCQNPICQFARVVGEELARKDAALEACRDTLNIICKYTEPEFDNILPLSAIETDAIYRRATAALAALDAKP